MNEVYGTMTMDFSVEVTSENEEMAMLEAGYMVDPLAIAHVIVVVIDVFGNKHEVNIHNYKSDLHMVLN